MTPCTRALIALCTPCTLSLNACFFAPQEVIRFRAERAGSSWSNDLELHSANTRQMEVRTGFIGYSHDMVHRYSGPHPLFFLISAVNECDSAILIDPLDFRISVPGKGRNLAAIDPVDVLYRARTDMAAEVASHAGYEGTTLAFGAIGAVLEVARTFSIQTPQEKSDWTERRERDEETKEDIRRRHREKMAELSVRERL